MTIRPETIKYTEQHLSTEHIDLGLREVFVNLASKAREVKAKINQWSYTKLKNFRRAKRTGNKQQGNQPNERRYLRIIPLVGS